MKKIIVALCLLLVSLPALSKQPLTTERVGKWLDAMQAMDEWSSSHPEMVEKLRKQAMSTKEKSAVPSFKRSADAARAAGVADQVEAVISPFGFSSLDVWGAYGDRVMNAFMALSMQKQHTGKMDEMMRKQLEALEKDNSIPAAQKQAMRQQIKQMQAMMARFASVPKADVEAVRPLQSRFEELGRQKMQRRGH